MFTKYLAITYMNGGARALLSNFDSCFSRADLSDLTQVIRGYPRVIRASLWIYPDNIRGR
jgi:hypothetical protein